MSAVGFYLEVVRALDELNAPYMLVGAFAGLSFGVRRTTFDVDILVDLQEPDFDALAQRFPSPRYYADPVQMRESTRLGIMFNIIDSSEGVKADLAPLPRQSNFRVSFERRIRRIFRDEVGHEFQAWCARPEDIIIGKLMAWAEGESAKHPADIFDMLIFVGSGSSDVEFDPDIVTTRAAALGGRVPELWRELQKRAHEEIDKRV